METRERKIKSVKVAEVRYTRSELVAFGEGYILKTATGKLYQVQGVHEAERYGKKLGYQTCELQPLWPDGESGNRWRSGQSRYPQIKFLYGSDPIADQWFLADASQEEIKKGMAAAKEERERAEKRKHDAYRAAAAAKAKDMDDTAALLNDAGIPAEPYGDKSGVHLPYGHGLSADVNYSNKQFKFTTYDRELAARLSRVVAEYKPKESVNA